MIGVTLEKAPQDYQILQQEGGKATLTLSGRYEKPQEGNYKVIARVCGEDDGRQIVGWTALPAGDGCFSGSLTLPVGGPYRLETGLIDENNLVFEWAVRGDMRFHLYVGDLYVIAGQSNSAGYGKGPFCDPPKQGVHLFRNCGRWDMAAHPLNETTATAFPVSAEGANPGHSPWLAFGKAIYKAAGVPVGLIQTSLGGSPLSRWNPDEEGDLYAAMIERIRLCGGKVRGILWYQGCSDADAEKAPTYTKRFANMVRRTREDLGQPELPFFTVQLNRCTDPGSEELDRYWAVIRESQRQSAKDLAGVYLVPANDLPLSDGIHNSAAGNLTLGGRTADQALRVLYGQETDCPFAPDVKKAVQTGEREITLMYENVQNRLCSTGPAFPADAEDGEGLAPAAGVRYEGAKVILTFDRAIRPGAKLHIAWRKDLPAYIPMEAQNHLPVLSRYEVEVERD